MVTCSSVLENFPAHYVMQCAMLYASIVFFFLFSSFVVWFLGNSDDAFNISCGFLIVHISESSFFFSPRSEKRGCKKRCTILKDFYYILNYGIESFYESSIIYLLVFCSLMTMMAKRTLERTFFMMIWSSSLKGKLPDGPDQWWKIYANLF